MSPEERQMLTDLFERVRGQANAPRDRDAETLIADAIRTQPYAPYLLTQAVLLQEQALRAADQKLQEMQAQVAHLEDELAHAQAQPAPSSGSFLGGLFGGGASRPAQQQPAARGSSTITMKRQNPTTIRLTILATLTTRPTMISPVAATITATTSNRSIKKLGWPV